MNAEHGFEPHPEAAQDIVEIWELTGKYPLTTAKR